MYSLVKKLLANEKIRYLIAGGCTTLVNLITFFVLRTFTHIERNTSNVIAVMTAIAFAYFANKFFVFRSKTRGALNVAGEAVSFVAARMVTLVVEVLGFAILCDSFRLSELVSKLTVQLVVVVLNYIFNKLFVFNGKRRDFCSILKNGYCYYLSFFIVFFVMLAIFIAEKIMPFGSNSLTIVDSVHQYLPFFSDYRDKLLHEGSLFYTWNVAMGSNFVSLFAYYLSSPFNYVLLLFSKESIAMVASMLVSLKICLSAVTMAHYLSCKGGKKSRDYIIIAISVCYALSNYVVGYYWNTMWMDCILIFPLIILGFERLMEEGDPKCYVLSLFYCLYCNYYIGFIICLFLVLWFFVYHHQGVKKFFQNGIKFAGCSLVSGGMAAFLLIPAYLGIMSTASAKMELPKWEWYGNIFVMFKQQLFLTDPITNQTFDGGVNLYCGMLAVLAMFLYFFSDQIKLGEKIRKLFLLAVLMVSFNSTTLNYIWHGMHDQYGIPNRFSFLYIFLLLVMTYEVLLDIEKVHLAYIMSAAFLGVSFVLACDFQSGISASVFTVSVAMIAVYTVIFILRSLKKINKMWFHLLLSCICVIELVVSSVSGFFENGYADFNHYYSTSKNVTAANQQVARMAEEENVGFYRSELMDPTVLDEASWHNMPSVGTFCSTVLGEMTSTMGRLGFYTGANEFLYMGSTPFTNSIFNVRYLLEREGDLNNFDFEYVGTVEDVGIYENPYPLSIAFAVSNRVKDWDRDGGRPIENQNKLADAMTKAGGFFNSAFPKLSVKSDNCTVSVSGAVIDYTPYVAGDASLMVSFVAERPGDYYLNCRGNNINKIHFYINGEELAYDRYQGQLFHLGELAESDYVSVEYVYKNISPSPAMASLYMATLDEEGYMGIYRRLSEHMLSVEEYDDGYLRGTITMPEDSTLFTSIPYDEGWKLWVDGKEAEYYMIMGSFIGIDMEVGDHEIELIYTPRGMYLGLLISVVCWLIFITLILQKNDKKGDAVLAKNHENEIDHEEII